MSLLPPNPNENRQGVRSMKNETNLIEIAQDAACIAANIRDLKEALELAASVKERPLFDVLQWRIDKCMERFNAIAATAPASIQP